MEKKKMVSKTTKKTAKATVKKTTKKVAKKEAPKISTKKKKKKGFTLIELLAVIIILGILMIIAIPSVTSYISNSRKSAYVNTAKEVVAGTRNAVNEGKLGMYSTDTTYYIPYDYIKSENGTKSPYGEFVYAYVGVIYDGKGYTYYWISVDDAGQGIDEVTPVSILNEDNIKSDINALDIKQKVDSTGIGGRKKVLVLENGSWVTKTENAQNNIPEEGGSGSGGSVNSSVIQILTSGKTRDNLEIGDELTIGNEHFNVLGFEGTDIKLLAKYNLYVGNKYNGYTYASSISEDDPNYLKQNSICLGEERGSKMCTLPFSSSCYWTFEEDYKSIYDGTQNAKPIYGSGGYVNNPNYSVAYYVQQYETYLKDLGANIKSARLGYYDELNNAKNILDGDGIKFVYNTTFYTSSSVNSRNKCAIWSLRGQSTTNGYWNGGYYNYPDRDGVRPVIIIEKSSI